jgi:hypothetical protein
MNVTAPPGPPPLEDPELEPGSAGDDPEALIEEARERARRRRRRYAALALTMMLAGLGAYLGLSAGGAAPSASVNVQQPAQPLVSGPPDGFEVWFLLANYGPNEAGGCCFAFPTSRTAAELGISPDRYDDFDWAKPDPRLLEALIQALIAGPTPDERANPPDPRPPGARGDWASVFYPNIQLLGVSVNNGIVTIDIASEFDPTVRVALHDDEDVWHGPYLGEEESMRLSYPDGEFSYEAGAVSDAYNRFSQLVFTVTQFPSVRGVQFELDGQRVGARIDCDVGNCSNYRGEWLGSPVDRPVTRQDYEGNNGPLDACRYPDWQDEPYCNT